MARAVPNACRMTNAPDAMWTTALGAPAELREPALSVVYDDAPPERVVLPERERAVVRAHLLALEGRHRSPQD